MSGATLERTDSFQYPTGHVNHLSAAQTAALDDFKLLCQQNGYYTPATASAPATHDDETLLRYLRARKFVSKEAFGQFKDTEDWRKENKLDSIYDSIDVDEYEETRRLYPQWTGRRDKRGIPVYVFEVANLDSKKMSAYESAAGKAQSGSHLPPKMLRLFALYENLTRFVMPLCSAIPNRQHPETPVSQSNNIVDISRVSLRQFWNLKGHMQDASTLATAHYPETLDRIFIIGAPSFFPTVWNWIKRWFDPITVSKIFILSANEVKPTLERFIDINNIPSSYGGKLEWKWGQLPALEPEILETMGWPTDGSKSIPTGPIKWKEASDGSKVEAHAVGSQQGQRRDQVLTQIPASIFYKSSLSSSTPAVQTPAEQQATTKTFASNTNHPESSMSNSSNREGTSESKFVAQSSTLADGQLAHGTPETRDHGYGDKTTTMEPKTVGQAAKDVDVPTAEEPAPSYLQEAQAAATAAGEKAYEAGSKVLAATGLMGGEKPKAPEVKQEVRHDPKIDALGKEHVEDFMRSQYTSNQRAGDTILPGGQDQKQ